MNYRIVKYVQLSGRRATVYTLVRTDGSASLFDTLLKECATQYPKETENLVAKLRTMGQQTGLRTDLFRIGEGLPGDLVVAVSDDVTATLRAYGIRYGNSILLLGAGGPKLVRAWQDDPKLKQAAEEMIAISKAMKEKMQNREIGWTSDEMEWTGDLTLELDDEQDT
ncbi:MAG: hypothetical protein IPK70_14775 [Flavobacteriales bacterium]|jgi:hypothetical protein|nr:hypothetical protein [Flavobacteriales bacterium]